MGDEPPSHATSDAALTVAVIVPVLDEERELAARLPGLMALGADEFVFVDGGSRDGTVAHLERDGQRVIHAPRGRASQLNAGARATRSAALLFVHVDTVPPLAAVAHARAALSDPAVAGGAFTVSIAGDGPVWPFLSYWANLRARLTEVPYGDQGIFVHRETFEAVGGFPELPVLEDVAFSRALKRRGRVALIDDPMRTSARRFRREGIVYTVVRNWMITLAFVAGVPAARLARHYSRERSG